MCVCKDAGSRGCLFQLPLIESTAGLVPQTLSATSLSVSFMEVNEMLIVYCFSNTVLECVSKL